VNSLTWGRGLQRIFYGSKRNPLREWELDAREKKGKGDWSRRGLKKNEIVRKKRMAFEKGRTLYWGGVLTSTGWKMLRKRARALILDGKTCIL